jgi:glycerol-3-phosphate dehydrogenase
MRGSPPGSVLGPAARAEGLALLAKSQLDVLVVGGGVTGAGIALDAVTRGLSVALVEQHDFAWGTSSRSSKLIHGGLRYVEQRNFGLVREALHERRLLLTRIAPHLVCPVPFLLPIRHRWERGYLGAGVALYDGLGGLHPEMPRHRHLGRRATLASAPALREDGLLGAIRYFDAKTDDARLALSLLRTALAHGATAVSGAEVTAFLGGSRIEGVRLRDVETDDAFDVRAKVTVLAAGVWTRELEALAGVADPIAIRASKGVHLLVPRERLELSDALIVRAERSVLLVIPWGEHWLIGTTDTPWPLGSDRPTATADDIAYLLGHVNEVLRRPLTRGDVTGVFAGLRPLIDSGTVDTAKISREHVVREPRPGLVSIAGGKLTTYRVMAEDAVEAAARQLGIRVDPSRTEELPLVGAEGLDVARAELARAEVAPVVAERLLSRYGALAPEVAALAAADPALGASLPDAAPYLGAEIAYAVSHEGARRLEDVLVRRTRISIEAHDRGRSAAPAVAKLMAKQLGWSTRRVRDEVAAYLRSLDAELAAEAGACEGFVAA